MSEPGGLPDPSVADDLPPETDDPARDDDPEADWPSAAHVAAARRLDTAAALAVLRQGRIDLVGQLLASSNNALVGTVRSGANGGMAVEIPCVYKPIRGERPLWDFPDGSLAGREVAAFEVSEAGGWRVVPPTVLRTGRFGPGMVQLWLEPDHGCDRIELIRSADERLRAIALFDAVINNADRKIGHLLPQPDGRIVGIDHGICFHEETKLRTVLWHWQREALRPAELARLEGVRTALDGSLGERLRPLIAGHEIEELGRRLDRLLATGRFPAQDPDRPTIPWPPY